MPMQEFKNPRLGMTTKKEIDSHLAVALKEVGKQTQVCKRCGSLGI